MHGAYSHIRGLPKVSFDSTSSSTAFGIYLQSLLRQVKEMPLKSLSRDLKSYENSELSLVSSRRLEELLLLNHRMEARKYPRRCVWCDEETEHTLRGCESYEEALKNDLVLYKDGKIHDAATNSPLRTNFGRGGMKKLMEEKLTRSDCVQAHRAETYHVQVEHHTVGTSSVQSHVQMKRGAQAIRGATGWERPC